MDEIPLTLRQQQLSTFFHCNQSQQLQQRIRQRAIFHILFFVKDHSKFLDGTIIVPLVLQTVQMLMYSRHISNPSHHFSNLSRHISNPRCHITSHIGNLQMMPRRPLSIRRAIPIRRKQSVLNFCSYVHLWCEHSLAAHSHLNPTVELLHPLATWF